MFTPDGSFAKRYFMKRVYCSTVLIGLLSVLTNCTPPHPPRAAVVPHQGLRTFSNQGNDLVGIATKSQGAREFETWRTSVAVGSRSPVHSHDSEEIFVMLRGKGQLIIGGEPYDFEAPCTLIAPAKVQHQFINTGDVPTDAIVIVGIDSKIYAEDGETIVFPWR